MTDANEKRAGTEAIKARLESASPLPYGLSPELDDDVVFIDNARQDIAALLADNARLLEACHAQHNAIDILFAMLIQRDKTFLPSKSGEPWAAFIMGNNALAASGRAEEGA